MGESRNPFGYTENGPNLTSGTAGVIEKGDQFLGGTTFKILGNVVRDGKSCTLNLVGDVAFKASRFVFRQSKHFNRQGDGCLPGGRIFKAFVFHPCFLSGLRSEI